jgi:CubicO group peptidase (beta-lactamase class C family)
LDVPYDSGFRLSFALRASMLTLAFAGGCAAPRPADRDPAPAFLSHAARGRLDAAAAAAIDRWEIEGAVLIVGRGAAVLHAKAYGARRVAPGAPAEPMTLDTIFDLASLTKVAATGMALALLLEEGRATLDDPVARHLPEWPDRDLSLRHLATHTSGFAAYLDAGAIARNHPGVAPCDAVLAAIAAHQRKYPLGKGAIYSCINYELLGRAIEAAAGEDLESYLRRKLWRPLGMQDTFFRVPPEKLPRVAPTEGGLRGVVHDPLARFYGTGPHLPGNAGLFSTGPDLARFMAALACRGAAGGRGVVPPETVDLLFADHAPPESGAPRGIGWVIENDEGYLPRPGDRGVRTHGGFTGTFLWVHPPSGAFLIVLSSRLHPAGKGDVFPLRRAAARIVCEDLVSAPEITKR